MAVERESLVRIYSNCPRALPLRPFGDCPSTGVMETARIAGVMELPKSCGLWFCGMFWGRIRTTLVVLIDVSQKAVGHVAMWYHNRWSVPCTSADLGFFSHREYSDSQGSPKWYFIWAYCFKTGVQNLFTLSVGPPVLYENRKQVLFTFFSLSSIDIKRQK